MTVSSSTTQKPATPAQKPATAGKAAYLQRTERAAEKKTTGLSHALAARPGTPTPTLESSRVSPVKEHTEPTKKEVSEIFYKVLAPLLNKDPGSLGRLQTAREAQILEWLKNQTNTDPSNDVVGKEKVQQLETSLQDLQSKYEVALKQYEEAQSELREKSQSLAAALEELSTIKTNIESTTQGLAETTKALDEAQQSDAKDTELSSLQESIKTMQSELLALQQTHAAKLEELSALRTSGEVNSAALRALDETMAQVKAAVIVHAGELDNLMPNEGSPIGHITPEFITTTLRNCKEQVKDLKRKLGMEVEESETAASSDSVTAPEKERLLELQSIQSSTLALQGEVETKFPTEEVQQTRSLANDGASQLLDEFLTQLSERVSSALEVKGSVVRTIQDLQNQITRGNVPSFPSELLNGIATVSGWYTRENQELDITRHLKLQQEKITDLTDIINRWSIIQKALDELLCRINVLLLLKGEKEKKQESLDKIRGQIGQLYLEHDLISEPAVKDLMVMTQFNNHLNDMQRLATYLRDYRKGFISMPAPEKPELQQARLEALKAEYQTQKERLIEYNRHHSIINAMEPLILKLQKEVDLGQEKVIVPPDSLSRIATVQGRTAEDILEKDIKPFELAHLGRSAQLSALKSKMHQLKNSVNSAKKEVNRTYDAIQRKGVYTTESWWNHMGYTDSDIDATFDGGETKGLSCDSPQVPHQSIATSSR